MGTRVNYSGLVIAGIGFFLTRFTVTLAIYETPLRFYLAGVVPLALGLGLAAFGVALTVADVESSLVRTTARWCVVGAGAMLVLVFLTLLGSSPDGIPDIATMRSQTYLSNFLIGGSIGGTLTGLYAAHNRRQRETLHQQANRLEVLNRLLRHEILNSVAAIKGYATGGSPEEKTAKRVIEDRSDAIERTIEDVKYLTRSAGTSETATHPIDLEACLAGSIRAVEEIYPDASLSVESHPDGLLVLANERLEQAFVHLLENAIVHTSVDDPGVDVSITPTAHSVRVSVTDDGPGLPESQRTLLETGAIEEFDDPRMGYGLNIVRLLVESYRGTIETEVTGAGTTITVVLPRAEGETTGLQPSEASLVGVRPAIPHLVVTLGAALVAGLVYGIAAVQLGGSIEFIGVYYGIQHPVVGWLTHEFHSVVFGFVFVGLVTLAPAKYRNHVPAYVAVGTAWALVLWAVAAGLVSPIWLRLLGIPASIPSLSGTLLVSHLAWGISLGVLAALGYEHVTPVVARPWSRLRRWAPL